MLWNTTDDRALDVPVSVWEDPGDEYVEIRLDNGSTFEVKRHQLREVDERALLEAVIRAYDDEASYVGFTLTQGTLEEAVEAARARLAEDGRRG